MRPTEIWPVDRRIIEIDAQSGAVGISLLAAGYKQFLAVAPNERVRQQIVARVPQLSSRLAVRPSRQVARQNNADVLVLNGWSALALGLFRVVRHARCVAVPLDVTPLCWIAVSLGIAQVFLRRFGRPRLVRCSRSGPWLAAFSVRRPRPNNGVRRFIPHTCGVEQFLRQLSAKQAQHAVLRWFENLPHVSPGEDLDLLVADSDLEAVRAILNSGPGIQPIDLYSVTGLPGADFRSMPYFPPYLAEELLNSSVVQRGLCRVPAAREHFLSLAYHALYHKGAASGIPPRDGATRNPRQADHDYVTVLSRLAARLGWNVAMTLEGLDSYLDSQGWRPPHDMLIRLARRNRWLHSLLQKPRGDTADDRIAVFLVREEALRRGGIQRAEQLITAHGFEILESRTLDRRTAATLARSVRGGNWGRGPWAISGGPPVAAIAVFDPQPIAPSRQHKKKFPFLANARLLSKDKIRDAFNEGIAGDQHCNVIHSSDNGREAMDYLRIAMPDLAKSVMNRVATAPASRAA
jgi:hypothetical protein